MKQEVWWVQSLELYFLKYKNDMRAPAALQKLAVGCWDLNYQN